MAATPTSSSINTPFPATSPTINIAPIAHSTNDLVAINVTNHLPIKLTSTNYVSWSKQIKFMLIGYGIVGYITGATPYPLTTIVVDSKEVENSTFAH